MSKTTAFSWICRLCSIPSKWFYGEKAPADNTWNIPRAWRLPLWSIALVTVLSITIFFDTWSSIVAIWARSKTFTHGFVVAPISIWLIWTRRDYYRQLSPTFSYPALLAVLTNGFAWLAADLSHVLVIKQFTVVGMLVSAFWVVLGTRVIISMLFPLSFLFFMVPVGEELVPPLVEFTTTFTVTMLKLTGLTVYREGSFFTLTSGHWSVVEACSGINYLIASITLGFVYAYLNYNSYKKRALFMLLSCIVPIIANGFRAYMIVMIGHLSNMTLAVGVDHLIYGGIFFGLVMLLLFYLGSFWRDPDFTAPIIIPNKTVAGYGKPQALAMLATISLVFSIWPLGAARLLAQQTGNGLPDYLATVQLPDWKPANTPNWQWMPRFNGAVDQKTVFYSDGSKIIGLHHASFGKESQGYELVNSQNVLIQPADTNRFRLVHTSSAPLLNNGQSSVRVDKRVIRSGNRDILVLEWYQIGTEITANTYRVKWLQLLKRLTGDTSPELKVLLWTEAAHDEYDSVLPVLQSFSASWSAQNKLGAPQSRAYQASVR